MDRIKTFLKYAIWIILFFILSEFLINVSLNASYKDMERIDNTEQVEITEAQSTLVNGKVKGTIKNSNEDYLTGKYVRIDFYSKRDNIVGTKYITIETTENLTSQDFTIYFELQDVTSYEISIVDKKEVEEIEFIPEEWSKAEILTATLLTLMIFW